jgi:hypothetical protein
LKTNPDNPTFVCVFDPRLEDLYDKNKYAIKPIGLGVKKKKTSTRLQLRFGHCKTINSLRYTALAITFKPKVDTSLSEYKKSETNHVVFKQKLSELKPVTIEIYTDGSKDQGKAVTKNEIFSARLPINFYR